MKTNLRISDPDLRLVLAWQLLLTRAVQRRWNDGQTWYIAERFGKREAIAAVQHDRDTRAVRTLSAIAARGRV